MSAAVVQRLRAGRFRHVVFTSGFGAHRPVDHGAAPSGVAPPVVTADDDGEHAYFCRWLFKQFGLDIRQYRPETLNRRMPACLRALRVVDARQAKRLIEQYPELSTVALSALVIGVTSFFRDAPVFDYLTYHVLPHLPYGQRQARIWSCACSDGAETYSLAMLLSELGRLSEAYVLGTDCREDAVRRARSGIYDDHAMREVPQAWQERYFTCEQNLWKIKEPLRSAVQYRVSDMLTMCEPGWWDVILCRNAGMYLRPGSADRLWQSLEQVLRPGGFLVLGKAERPTGTTKLSAVAPCIYRRDRG